MQLHYLDFDFSDEDSGRGSFDAMASVAASRLPPLLAEVAAVLGWAGRAFGPAGALDDDGEWDYDLRATAEPDTPLASHLRCRPGRGPARVRRARRRIDHADAHAQWFGRVLPGTARQVRRRAVARCHRQRACSADCIAFTPIAIIPSIAGASASGSRSTVHTSRLPPPAASVTSTTAL